MFHNLHEVVMAKTEVLRLMQDTVETSFQLHELLPITLVLEGVVSEVVAVRLGLHHF